MLLLPHRPSVLKTAAMLTNSECTCHCTDFSSHCCLLGPLAVVVASALTSGTLVYHAGLAETQQLVSEALMQVLHTASETAGGANLTQTSVDSISRHLLSDRPVVQAADTITTTEVTPEHEGVTVSGSPVVLP